ncbi:nitroreductase family protein [Sphingomonas sp.]|jgi:nitroreductase|uniref:nitroreductase family protein n=1 Tax=Sphingomonas sp. TaxID=28214 RepID=UPI002619F826|nr:nitroreductase family protein [Sphingomonas sp.]MDF2494349.1 nitroreductase [Sphingomonas sp.]
MATTAMAATNGQANAGSSDSDSDTLERLLRERRSVRGFKKDPVPAELLERVMEMAQLAPSNCNVQPWTAHVVSGDAAERMRNVLHDAAKSGTKMTPDFPLTGAYPGHYRGRQIDAAKSLFAATNVAREDVAARTESFLRNFRFFDAPHAMFLFIPAWAGMREAADCGMYAQSFMLALTANGLASCAQGALSHHAEIVHRELGVGDDHKLLFGIAFGYEDPAHPANSARTVRDKDHVLHG